MRKERSILLPAFVRPRGLFILLLGSIASLSLGLAFSTWYFLVFAAFTVGAYSWSVYESLQDRDFIEEMRRPGLSASVDASVKLNVAAHRGGRLLEGTLKERHREFAATVERVNASLAGCPDQYREEIEAVTDKLTRLVVLFEDLGARLQAMGKNDGGDVENEIASLEKRIAAAGDDQRLALSLQGALDAKKALLSQLKAAESRRTRILAELERLQSVAALLENRVAALAVGDELDGVSILLEDVLDNIDVVESTVQELKLLDT